MKMRSPGILLALAAALLVTVACGSGGTDQASTDYFLQLSGILTSAKDQTTQLNAQYPVAGYDPDQTRQYLSQFLPFLTTLVSSIKNLNPPTTSKDLHDRFVAALEDLLAANTTLSAGAQSITTEPDMKAYFDSQAPDFSVKTNLVNSACLDLQSQANSKNLSVDLKCRKTSSSSPTATPVSGAATP